MLDTNHDGKINAIDFIVGVFILEHGTAKQRLRLFFRKKREKENRKRKRKQKKKKEKKLKHFENQQILGMKIITEFYQ